ncbi:hypothetical protein T458_06945 [Brevibacillus panacihumi W25]|uniref:Uncharacterized protein n=1 Tax=Brevibacillus panacihumi W25 TaxID=1408254 RepID=V6MAY5_9BACL|nr:hypothetical protein T458_06945 [Brevibacillus panacihumi W25]
MEIALLPAMFFAGMFAGFLMACIVGVTLWNRMREGG